MKGPRIDYLDNYYNSTFKVEFAIVAFIVAALNSLIYAYFEKLTA